MFEVSFGLDDEVDVKLEVDSPSVESLLQGWGSALGLDIAPNHTGVFVWDGVQCKTYGFKLDDSISQDDVFYDAKVRRFFKDKYLELFKGMHFEYVCIEGCYGGENYDTVKQLLNINTVFDELVLDGSITCDNFLRVKPSQWLAGLSRVVQMKGGYSTKYKTQEILKKLGFKFALDGEGKTKKFLEEIFYEDICDATGIVVGLRMLEKLDIPVKKSSSIGMSQIEVHYLQDLTDMYSLHGGFAYDICNYEVSINKRTIEKEIKRLVNEDGSQIYYLKLETTKLGDFGIKRGFSFYNQGFGWLVFYHKGLIKR